MNSTRQKIIVLFSILLLLVPLTALAQINWCEGNFDCDQDVDGTDASKFKSDFGRSLSARPCTNDDPCNGDFLCDSDVDGTDTSKFKSDFGRSMTNNPCLICVTAPWCNYTTTSSTTTTCDIEIVYGRPGRRGIPFTCNDVIDFTLCSDCSTFNPSCLIWTISPAASWLSIAQTDDCSWRLIIVGDYCCQEPDACGEYEITVTDTCNNASDTVSIEML